ncbi:MAG: ABC transporter permease subunit [Deltaproteobacteria bacterium]|nr:MAG: ABC transporter permease subunit [Deltaproteobacteria bacterium]
MAVTPSQAFSMDPSLLPDAITAQNFVDVIGTRTSTGGWLFGRQLFNSLFVSGVTSVVGIGLACTAGYAMSRWAFPGRDTGMALFLITQMFPGVVMAIPLYILLDKLHLLDSLLGLSLVYATTAIPFCTWNLKGYFDTIPRDLEEAAMMDGAGRWTTFTRIILPLARPALAVTGLFSFMTAWNEFILAATFMGDETAFTLPVVLQSYVGDFGTEWGRFAAGAIVVSVPVMVLFFVLQKSLVEGLTAGGVKG